MRGDDSGWAETMRTGWRALVFGVAAVLLLLTAGLANGPDRGARLNPRSIPPSANFAVGGTGVSAHLGTDLASLKLVNYYPAHNAWSSMWNEWNPAEVDSDFARIAGLNANAVRIIVQAYTFGYPTPSATMLSRLNSTLSLAAAHGLKVQLTLFDWWSDYSDLTGSQAWARAILSPLAGDPRITFVELKNEIDPANTAAMTWARAMIPYLQRLGGGIPVTVSTTGDGTSVVALRSALGSAQPDFYDYHYYGFPELARTALQTAQAATAGKSLYIGETGRSSASAVATNYPGTPAVPAALEAQQAGYLQAVEYAARSLGLPYAAPWTLYDFAPGAIPASGTADSPTEYGYGLLHPDGTWKASGLAVRSIFAGSIDTSFNNSFESGYIDGTTSLPTLWQIFDGGAGTFARDITVAHSGGASVRMTATGGSHSAWPAFFITPPAGTVATGHTYTLSAWARGLNATGQNLVAMAWFGADNSYLGSTQSPSLPTGTTTWTHLTVTGVAPAGAAYVQLHLKSYDNGGSVWYDDVAFSAQ